MGTQGPYRGPWGKPRGPFGAPGGDPGAPGGTKGPLRGPLEGLRVFSEPRLGPRIEPGFLTYTLLDVENANSLPQKEIQELGPWGGDRLSPPRPRGYVAKFENLERVRQQWAQHGTDTKGT